MIEREDKLDRGAKSVLFSAKMEAERLNHPFIGTEHLLLGLTRDDPNLAAAILFVMVKRPEQIRSTVLSIIANHPKWSVPCEITLTPGARNVIELAVDEAQRLNHDFAGPEHLLLGMLRETEGIAAAVLQSFGVEFGAVREWIKDTVEERK